MFFIQRNFGKLKYWFIRLGLRFWPPELFEKISLLSALFIARVVKRKVPVYDDFLKKNGLSIRKIRLWRTFRKLPIMDKNNYFKKYAVAKTLARKKVEQAYAWEQSSNYDPDSGFMLWPRFAEDEKSCVKNFDFMLRYYFNCQKKKTLVVIAFVLGLWAAGERISRFAKKISESGRLPLTVAAPGASRSTIIDLLKRVGQYYDQIILVGNPYFLRRVIEYGEKENFSWRSLDVKMITGAEGFSEDWREFVLKKIAADKEADALIINRIMSVFGVTETSGSFASESPLANLIRRLAHRDPILRQRFFGETDALPMVFQYNPIRNFLEIQERELLITRMTRQPILRFNTHDIARVIKFKEAIKILKESGYNPYELLVREGYRRADILPLPLFFIYGRNKNVLKVQGVAVTIEKLQEFFAHPELIKTNTGNFKADVVLDKDGVERLKLTVELMYGIKPTLELVDKYKEIFCKTSLGVESFLKFYDGRLEEIEPEMELIEKSQAPFSESEKPKHHYLKKD